MEIYLPIAEISVNWAMILGMGAAVGFLSGMFGVGGGFLMTPLLVFYGIPPAIAVATQASHITASSLSGVLANWRRQAVDEKMGFLLLAGGLAGSGGLAGTHGHMMGEPYRDGAGRAYTALIREPVFVFGATLDELRRTHGRALSRELVPALYIEPMFTTTYDADNRAAVAAADPDSLDLVGLGVHGPRKVIDKVVNGLKFLS